MKQIHINIRNNIPIHIVENKEDRD